MSKFKVLVTTFPFAQEDQKPIKLLEESGVAFDINPFGRKMLPSELRDLIEDYDALIAGTEIIDRNVLQRAKRLKLISRVGIGLDGVDLSYAKSRGISISFTPDAPAPAVAELTLAMILSLCRSMHIANCELHESIWKRHFGYRITEICVGVIGCGRIGSRVINLLLGIGCKNILVNDLNEKKIIDHQYVKFATKEEIYRSAKIISLHLPLYGVTRDLIAERELKMMNNGTFIVNTSRGGIVNEDDLYSALESGYIAGAAIDVFNREPYAGSLSKLKNCILTSHMGSMSFDCRAQMELEATEEVLRLFNGEPLKKSIPESEYAMREHAGL